MGLERVRIALIARNRYREVGGVINVGQPGEPVAFDEVGGDVIHAAIIIYKQARNPLHLQFDADHRQRLKATAKLEDFSSRLSSFIFPVILGKNIREFGRGH